MFFGRPTNLKISDGFVGVLAATNFLQDVLAQTTDSNSSSTDESTSSTIAFYVCTSVVIVGALLGIGAICYYRGHREPVPQQDPLHIEMNTYYGI